MAQEWTPVTLAFLCLPKGGSPVGKEEKQTKDELREAEPGLALLL